LTGDKIIESKDFSNPLDHGLIKSIKASVYKHLDDETFSVEVLCKEMALSRPVLFRKVKALTGQNIQNFIKIIRLQEARKLLLNNEHNITEVAYKTGFSNPKYFSVSFKKHYGVSPSKILKK
jgi:AraC-like DNA-binding protein